MDGDFVPSTRAVAVVEAIRRQLRRFGTVGRVGFGTLTDRQQAWVTEQTGFGPLSEVLGRDARNDLVDAVEDQADNIAGLPWWAWTGIGLLALAGLRGRS